MSLAFKQPMGEQADNSEENPNAEAWKVDPTIRTTENEPVTYVEDENKAQAMARAEDKFRKDIEVYKETEKLIRAAAAESVPAGLIGGDEGGPRGDALVNQYVREKTADGQNHWTQEKVGRSVKRIEQIFSAQGPIDKYNLLEPLDRIIDDEDRQATDAGLKAGAAHDILYGDKK